MSTSIRYSSICLEEWDIFHCLNGQRMSYACDFDCNACFVSFLKWGVTAKRYADGFLGRLGTVLHHLTLEPWFAEPLLLLLMSSNPVSMIIKWIGTTSFFFLTSLVCSSVIFKFFLFLHEIQCTNTDLVCDFVLGVTIPAIWGFRALCSTPVYCFDGFAYRKLFTNFDFYLCKAH